ncbi:MAG: phosphate ABC transporter ATP-binding protein PstB [Endomicrobium sp.]|jgi:phosphate transport system ATP-binding protein|uniref:phosphate ABC transporter ATP-binding protein PstB n=1 Tax=Candidatus Endomicrobiellum cubanum TaxID=3242325 RepID=UPI00281F3F5D|nr:phosphate ABC transporter ATP-binding protein PstB [Endomicrobium sp.]
MSKIAIKNFNLYYGNFHALKDVNIYIEENRITAMIGPSGCGKSTLLRSINRINDIIEGVKTAGEINIDGANIYDRNIDVDFLRRSVGMVFQRPNPFPISIYENVAFGLRVNRITSNKNIINETVEKSLKAVLLWDDIKDKLRKSALTLTLEQQQRLCIARLIAVAPRIILLDEPCSSLDPVATRKIEELMMQLKKDYTIVIVTHNMQQAARVSQDTAFMLLGKLIEFNKTDKIFTNPSEKETDDYVSGRFG